MDRMDSKGYSTHCTIVFFLTFTLFMKLFFKNMTLHCLFNVAPLQPSANFSRSNDCRANTREMVVSTLCTTRRTMSTNVVSFIGALPLQTLFGDIHRRANTSLADATET